MDIDDDGMRQVRPEVDKEWTRLWRTWRTVLEMLVDRVCVSLDLSICKTHPDTHARRAMRFPKTKYRSRATNSMRSSKTGQRAASSELHLTANSAASNTDPAPDQT
jgi:hypothetical protein